jgi:hypothetical protein
MASYKKKPEYRVVNYPTSLHKIAHEDFKGFLRLALGYSIYRRYLNEEGSHDEKINQVSDFFQVNIPKWENIEYAYQKTLSITPEKISFASIPLDLLWRLRRWENPFKEFEIMYYTYYLGIRSILGRKSYTQTNNDLILARAFGFNSISELDKKNHGLYLKYSTRKRIHRVQTYAIDNLGLKVLNDRSLGLRGFMVSCSIDAEFMRVELQQKRYILKGNEFNSKLPKGTS